MSFIDPNEIISHFLFAVLLLSFIHAYILLILLVQFGILCSDAMHL